MGGVNKKKTGKGKSGKGGEKPKRTAPAHKEVCSSPVHSITMLCMLSLPFKLATSEVLNKDLAQKKSNRYHILYDTEYKENLAQILRN